MTERTIHPRVPDRIWRERLAQLAVAKLDIITCRDCGSPCHRPHQCIFCGSSDP